MDNPPIAEEDRARYRQNRSALTALRDELNTNFVQNFADAVVDADSPQLKMLQAICDADLEDNVKDPLLREVVGRGGVRLDDVWARRRS
ncbi:hypothetical protein [Candidatus Mycobacterium methanotrophicum]|uniref:Uncharacterized protein n=1 Tax=Candidatus Mycobacterium methanotrophicum TaxID=2943498 RepID=A0ABY4QKN0_9MYCO|nr:hypothetical protein [Candidatus Mycobacterium methanotrophicum]UQX11141.1 hypothetical protein M5I08_00725 [Candidatus Mycobacterium methanotrophicum]